MEEESLDQPFSYKWAHPIIVQLIILGKTRSNSIKTTSCPDNI